MTSRAKNKSIRNVKNDPNGRWMFSKLRSCVPDANNKRRHAAARLLFFFFLNFKLILTLNEWKARNEWKKKHTPSLGWNKFDLASGQWKCRHIFTCLSTCFKSPVVWKKCGFLRRCNTETHSSRGGPNSTAIDRRCSYFGKKKIQFNSFHLIPSKMIEWNWGINFPLEK